LHQVFTKLAAPRIADGIGGFIVEAAAAASILAYLAFLFLSGQWNQQASVTGIAYSMLTGVCVGAGTVFFFLLFQKGGPLSAALMAIVGIVVFHEQASWPRLLGIALSIAGLYLLRM
jgi:transporter family protein